MDLLTQIFPQIMGDATRARLGAALGAAGLAAGGSDGFVHRQNDVGNAQFARRARQAIAATGAAHAGDQPAAPQLGEQLFQIGKRDVLPRGDVGQRHRAGVGFDVGGIAGQVGHGHDRVSSLGAQPHGSSFSANRRFSLLFDPPPGVEKPQATGMPDGPGYRVPD